MVGQFEAKFKVEELFCASIYEPFDRGMVVLQLCCWKFSHKETKKQKSLFEPRFGGLSGNYTLRL